MVMDISRLKQFFSGDEVAVPPETEITFLLKRIKKDNPKINDTELLEKKTRLLSQIILTRLNTCNSCSLAETEYHSQKVPGVGSLLSPLMLIGEGPGIEEDRLGQPFVGKAGKLLDRILTKASINKDKIYITNIVKCRPPNNRAPLNYEIEACSRNILFEIAAINPAVIIALGSIASSFLGIKKGIMQSRGQWVIYKDNIWVMPTYHPAYLLRQSGRALVNSSWQVWNDFQNAIQKVKSLRPDYDLR